VKVYKSLIGSRSGGLALQAAAGLDGRRGGQDDLGRDLRNRRLLELENFSNISDSGCPEHGGRMFTGV
jgi:hypothetical protein